METYLIFAVMLWWAIEWIKKCMDKFQINGKAKDIVILILALFGGTGMAIGYNLDLFVLLGVQDAPTIVGQIFAGLGIASGSGGVFELLKSIKNIGNAGLNETQEKLPGA